MFNTTDWRESLLQHVFLALVNALILGSRSETVHDITLADMPRLLALSSHVHRVLVIITLPRSSLSSI